VVQGAFVDHGLLDLLESCSTMFRTNGDSMLDSEVIHNLTREAKPVDYRMLKSYVARAPSAQYVREVLIPSLRQRHPAIWQRVDSQPFNN
jgi:hypothetical protein